MHYIICHLTHDWLAAATPRQLGEAKKTAPHSSINKGKRKGTPGSLGSAEEGKLAHIRLIRGPQSPLTFASQSQV